MWRKKLHYSGSSVGQKRSLQWSWDASDGAAPVVCSETISVLIQYQLSGWQMWMSNADRYLFFPKGHLLGHLCPPRFVRLRIVFIGCL